MCLQDLEGQVEEDRAYAEQQAAGMAAEHAAAVHAAAESRLAVAHTAEQLAALDATGGHRA